MITITDCRKAGHCASGVKRWFDDYGLDFRDFLKNGIDEEVFLGTGDARAIRIVALKHERGGENGKV